MMHKKANIKSGDNVQKLIRHKQCLLKPEMKCSYKYECRTCPAMPEEDRAAYAKDLDVKRKKKVCLRMLDVPIQCSSCDKPIGRILNNSVILDEGAFYGDDEIAICDNCAKSLPSDMKLKKKYC